MNGNGMSWPLLLLYVTIASAAQTLLKSGAVEGAKRPGAAWQTFLCPRVWAAYCLFLCSSVIWVLVLRKSPLGAAFAMTSVLYVIVLCISAALFHEPVGPWKILGVGLICAGMACMTR